VSAPQALRYAEDLVRGSLKESMLDHPRRSSWPVMRCLPLRVGGMTQQHLS
jgi:hypothetical protein